VASYGVSADDQRFLTEVGLPAWAAPYMYFFFDGGPDLPQPHDAYDRPIPGARPGLGMIGSNAEEWPICLDPTQPGRVLCLRLEPGLPLQLLNSSASQLAACLLAYSQTVNAALAWGAAHGLDDAWRKRQYPSKLDVRLRDRMHRLDPPALSSEGYWSWHFLHREAGYPEGRG
jgi:hypothetical protein